MALPTLTLLLAGLTWSNDVDEALKAAQIDNSHVLVYVLDTV